MLQMLPCIFFKDVFLPRFPISAKLARQFMLLSSPSSIYLDCPNGIFCGGIALPLMGLALVLQRF